MDIEIKKELKQRGKSILNYRILNGYSKKRLCDILNISRPTLNRYESGGFIPEIVLQRLENLEILADDENENYQYNC